MMGNQATSDFTITGRCNIVRYRLYIVVQIFIYCLI